MTPTSLDAEGPAFPKTTKLLASALMAALLVWGWRAADKIIAAPMSLSAYAFLLAAVVALLCCYAALLRSRTSISATHITQHWLWTKRVALEDVTQAKLIHLPALSWLVAPRLMVKVRGRGLYTFHIADPAVLATVKALRLGRATPY